MVQCQTPTVAVIQMGSTACIEANLRTAERLLAQAAEAGCQLAVLPENFACLGHPDPLRVGQDEVTAEGPIRSFLARMARRYGMWLIGGTLPTCIRPDGSRLTERVRAACFVLDAEGRERARYDKMWLFDVDVADAQGRYRESDRVEPGEQLVVVDTPVGRIGLSVCYDVRFPELYRRLVEQGAQLLAVPSAFTRVTGRAHWRPLLQARAIENACFVLAPNQEGVHSATRTSWGHSMIINPWGDVLAQGARGEQVLLAGIDLVRLQTVREQIPAWRQRTE